MFHNSSCCLSINGEIVSALHEDRFVKRKNEVALPINAIKRILDFNKIDPKEIDKIGIVNDKDSYKSYDNILNFLTKRQSEYSVQDWQNENYKYWYPKFYNQEKFISSFKVLGGKKQFSKNHFINTNFYNEKLKLTELNQKFLEEIENALYKNFKFKKEIISYIPHYLCHHYHAFYSFKKRKPNNSLILHAEGFGGLYNLAISMPTNKGIKILNGTNNFNLGRLYQWTTLALGMKPYNDEYKVMGLAAYSKKKEHKKLYLELKKHFKIDVNKISIEDKIQTKDIFFHFREIYKDYRFDNIAGAVQKLLEYYLTKWVKLAILKYKKNEIYYGGGVAMNVKANLQISKINQIKKFFVPLSPADETNVIGANYFIIEKEYLKKKMKISEIKHIKTPYLGDCFTQDEVYFQINRLNKKYKFDIKSYSDDIITNYLSENKIIARFDGKAEFGQRALGNRSILIAPNSPHVKTKLNNSIKSRDFWMPFALTVLDFMEGKYFRKNSFQKSPYMTTCFEVKKEFQNILINGLHEVDNTARPQIIVREQNEKYYDLIYNYYKKTGIGAVVNTSFNIHGETIANSPKDAIQIFLKTNIDCLIIGDYILSK